MQEIVIIVIGNDDLFDLLIYDLQIYLFFTLRYERKKKRKIIVTSVKLILAKVRILIHRVQAVN